MKHPTILLAFIALAARVMTCGLVFVCAINGNVNRWSFTHRGDEVVEVCSPSLADADTFTTVWRELGVTTGFDRDPNLVCGREAISRAVSVLRLVPVSESAIFTLSRSAVLEVPAKANGFGSAVASTEPFALFDVLQHGPLAELLSDDVDDAGLVRAVAAHGYLAGKQVWREVDLFGSAIAAAVPVLTENVRDHDVLAESLTGEVFESLVSGHVFPFFENTEVRSNGEYLAAHHAASV